LLRFRPQRESHLYATAAYQDQRGHYIITHCSVTQPPYGSRYERDRGWLSVMSLSRDLVRLSHFLLRHRTLSHPIIR